MSSTEHLDGEPVYLHADVYMAEHREHEMFRGLARIDGPWVHLTNAETAKSPRYSMDAPQWQRTEDRTFSASEVREIRWVTEGLDAEVSSLSR